ncbi:hypothetical protein Goshw_022364 [Gossypium schwendimanii]|uniref:Uncharacterized protein n=1 Tax=Gossypium schwendimanii TaxID=34291 RepID=A0A7J9MDM6_GOSSC|nr:hypothetical protein [Gossypium schwendimanii]
MSLVRYDKWERFRVTLKENVVIPLVHEFYATLKDKEARRPHGVQWKLLMVREETNMHRGIDPLKYEAMCEWPEDWDFFSLPSDGTLQKRRGSTRGERAIHVPNERMFQRHLKGKEHRHLEKNGARIEEQEAEVGKESTEEREEDEETNYFEE